MRRCYLSLVLLLIVALSACSHIQPSEPAVVKSHNDQREYRYLQLPNAMRVLLISDPATDKAAASLDVNVGSGRDPESFLGLAHFLEHMLFLGTEKYPQAGEYQAFINAHSGSHNAYTAFEHTNYFFDIDPDYLEPTLDRFAQFFVAPLFTPKYVEREKNAVHSEYTAKIKDERRRALDVFKQVVNPEHPFAKFSVGNLDTLQGGEQLREQLLAFYQRYYSADAMTLVVLGREPLDVLERMVGDRFSSVLSRQVTDINEASSEPLFVPGHLPAEVFIVPEQEQRLLTLTFPVPGVVDHYRVKPLAYLGNILGHEGKGSLLSYLKQQGWAEQLGAGTGLSYDGGATFTLTIKLTPAGLEARDDVVTAVYQAIARIRAEGVKPWRYAEQQALAEQQFRYQESQAPIHTVSQLANAMHNYAPVDLLRGEYMMAQFDQQLIEGYLNALRPENSLLTVNAPGLPTDQRSPFYDVPYRVKPVDAERLAKWQRAELNQAIKQPAANEFVAESFTLKPGSGANKPSLLVDQPGLRLWYLNDDEYQVPKGSLYIRLLSPMSSDTANHAVTQAMYARLLNDYLNEFSYPASLAGLHYRVEAGLRGLTITLSGFDDKQPLMLQKLLAATREQFSQQRFESLKAEKLRELQNAAMRQPYQGLLSELSQQLYRGRYSEQAQIDALQRLTLDDVVDYVERYLSAVSIEALVYGNYSVDDARRVAAAINDAVHLSGLQEPVTVAVKMLANLPQQLPVSSPYTDAALLYYLQSAHIGKPCRASFGLAAQMIQASFYTQLRTERQLGYIVMSGAYPVFDVPGLFFLVQSPVVGSAKLQSYFDAYLDSWLLSLDQLDEAAFERHREALRVRLLEQPKNQWQQGEHYWRDIQYGYQHFDSRQQIVRALDALQFDRWRQHMREHLATDQRGGLWLYSSGQLPGEASLVPLNEGSGSYKTFP